MTARERSLPRVRPYVTLEEPRAGERFPADAALARQRVGSYVHLECTQAHVVFVAILTRKLSRLGIVLGFGGVNFLLIVVVAVTVVGFVFDIVLMRVQVLCGLMSKKTTITVAKLIIRLCTIFIERMDSSRPFSYVTLGTR